MSVSSNFYTTNGFEVFNNPTENLVKGMPESYTKKFYKTLSIMVKQETKLVLNNSTITVRPESGWQINPELHSPIYEFRILTPNALVYYGGSW